MDSPLSGSDPAWSCSCYWEKEELEEKPSELFSACCWFAFSEDVEKLMCYMPSKSDNCTPGLDCWFLTFDWIDWICYYCMGGEFPNDLSFSNFFPVPLCDWFELKWPAPDFIFFIIFPLFLSSGMPAYLRSSLTLYSRGEYLLFMLLLLLADCLSWTKPLNTLSSICSLLDDPLMVWSGVASAGVSSRH